MVIAILAISTLQTDTAHQVVAQACAVCTLDIDGHWESLGCTALFELAFDVDDVGTDDLFDLRGHERSGMRESLGDVLTASGASDESLLVRAQERHGEHGDDAAKRGAFEETQAGTELAIEFLESDFIDR